jgi:hypothetical protein
MSAYQVANCRIKNATQMHLLGQDFGRMVLSPLALAEKLQSSITAAIYGISGSGKSVLVAGTAFALAFGVTTNFSETELVDTSKFQHADFFSKTYKLWLFRDFCADLGSDAMI